MTMHKYKAATVRDAAEVRQEVALNLAFALAYTTTPVTESSPEHRRSARRAQPRVGRLLCSVASTTNELELAQTYAQEFGLKVLAQELQYQFRAV